MNRTASTDSGDLLPCSSFPGPHRTLVICNSCIAASPRLVSEYYWFACVLSPLLSRACGTSSSKTKSWRGWSNRTCWERQCHQYSICLSVFFIYKLVWEWRTTFSFLFVFSHKVPRDPLLPGRRREDEADGHPLLLCQRKWTVAL